MQKFKMYDYVKIKNLDGTYSSHFPHSTEAIVLHSYKEMFGGDDDKSYCLFVKDHGEVCWYDEWQFELIDHNRMDIFKTWRDELEEAEERESDLDWIFKHGKELMEGKSVSGTIASTLFDCLTGGGINMWGQNGEGFVFWRNGMMAIEAAMPFLKNGDKEGWLNFCKEFNSRISAKNSTVE